MNKIGLLLALGTATFVVAGVSLANAAAPAPVGAQVAKKDTFSIDSSGACKVGAECVLQLTLTAIDQKDPKTGQVTSFHVNKEYPYKFKATDTAGVDYTGTDEAGKNVFSKRSGDFSLDATNEKVGVMKVHFKAAKAGAMTIPGTFKLSVCSAENCQLETADLSIPVVVK